MSTWPCVYFSSHLFCFPIDDFQRKCQLLMPTSCCSFKPFSSTLLAAPDQTVYYVHPTNRVTTEINLRSERMLSGVERWSLVNYSKDQSGSATVVRDGWEISGQQSIGEVTGWSAVEDGCDRWEVKMNMLEKDLEKQGNEGGSIFSEEDCELLFLFTVLLWWLLFTHSRPFAQLFIFPSIERLLPSCSTFT